MKLAFIGSVALCLALMGCASEEKAGDACSQENAGVCESDTVALFCNDGKLRAIPCSGPSGCTESTTQVSCDFSRARPGEACPKANENQGQCDSASANQLLRCSAGSWKAEPCDQCTVQGGQLFCQQ